MGAIKREMNNAKWTWAAIGYMCGFAYIISLMVYQFGRIFSSEGVSIGIIFAIVALFGIIYFLVRKNKYEETED